MTTANEWEVARVLLSGYGSAVGVYLLVAALADWRRLRESDVNGRALLMLQGRSLADGMSLVAQVCLLITGLMAMDAPPSPSVPVHFPYLAWVFQPTYSLISVALVTSSLGRAYLRRRIS